MNAKQIEYVSKSEALIEAFKQLVRDAENERCKASGAPLDQLAARLNSKTGRVHAALAELRKEAAVFFLDAG